MNQSLFSYYEGLEQASIHMLEAAKAGDWDQVIRLEDICVLLISQLREALKKSSLTPEEAIQKVALMKRILVNDAEIRKLAAPYLDNPNKMLPSNPATLH